LTAPRHPASVDHRDASFGCEQRTAHVPVVARAALVLQALGEDERGRRSSELSRELGVSKNTLSGLLSTLEQFDLVERDPDPVRARVTPERIRARGPVAAIAAQDVSRRVGVPAGVP
jgi:hypothetical protein